MIQRVTVQRETHHVKLLCVPNLSTLIPTKKKQKKEEEEEEEDQKKPNRHTINRFSGEGKKEGGENTMLLQNRGK